jgi:hypothetical protein
LNCSVGSRTKPAESRARICERTFALGHSAEKLGNAQWIGHILKRLQLIDNARRKHYVGGKLYAIERHEVLDMMHRYDVPPIDNDEAK